jgi:hypothetical protein
MGLLARYAATPGELGAAPARWPAGISVLPEPGRPTLLLFLHPRCPCSDASIEEAARVLARVAGPPPRVLAVMVRPSDHLGLWDDTPRERALAGTPGFLLVHDVDGELARAFGARTSGLVLAYDRTGELVFQGGVTAGRGHAGETLIHDELVRFLQGAGTPARGQYPVFGCPLWGRRDLCGVEGAA